MKLSVDISQGSLRRIGADQSSNLDSNLASFPFCSFVSFSRSIDDIPPQSLLSLSLTFALYDWLETCTHQRNTHNSLLPSLFLSFVLCFKKWFHQRANSLFVLGIWYGRKGWGVWRIFVGIAFFFFLFSVKVRNGSRSCWKKEEYEGRMKEDKEEQEGTRSSIQQN